MRMLQARQCQVFAHTARRDLEYNRAVGQRRLGRQVDAPFSTAAQFLDQVETAQRVAWLGKNGRRDAGLHQPVAVEQDR